VNFVPVNPYEAGEDTELQLNVQISTREIEDEADAHEEMRLDARFAHLPRCMRS
jgi:hypothetical protein